MSTKTSTAALDSRRPTSSRKPQRLPRRPAGPDFAGSAFRNRPPATARVSVNRRSKPLLDRTCHSEPQEESLFLQPAQLAIGQEDRMKTVRPNSTRSIRVILPVILRITFSLILWTIGAVPMRLSSDTVNSNSVSFASTRSS